METSQILKFYDHTNVFITGGTGFLGKILIEKLLRSTSVSTLYILVRAKKGKNSETRIRDLFDDAIFDRLRKECPKFIHRIVGIEGDVSMPNLGISQTDKQTLIENINIVFHGAATVKFDENLKFAYRVNVDGVKAILELGKQMKNLKSIMHVSTAFSNCHLQEIEEKFYDSPIDYKKVGGILESFSAAKADMHTSRIIEPWPNTYTFTKALAESMIRETSDDLPIGVFRPSIVISTYKEPAEAWIDNLYGPIGISTGVYTGILRVLHCDKHKKADLVPVDMCVAALIAAAWDTAEKRKTGRSPENIPIYNYVSAENTVTWDEYCTINQMYANKYPCTRTIWKPILYMTNNIYLYMFMKVFFHLIPAFIIDVVSSLFFRNLGLMNIYKKVHKLSCVLGYFTNREWAFANDNVVKLWNNLDASDKQTFYFDMASLDWWAYYKNYLLGIRRYIANESMDTMKSAKRKRRIFEYLHQFLIILVNFTVSVVVWILLFRVFGSSKPSIGVSNM